MVPYVTLYPETRAALEADGIAAEYVDVSGSPSAYHDALEAVWRGGVGFTVVEQDIVVWPGALKALWACEWDWCGYAYSIGTHYGSYLGCVRFSDELVAGFPGAFDAIAVLPPDGTPRRYWGRLDTRLKSVLETAGHEMHVHWPLVGHLNPDKPDPIINCRCGRAVPYEIVRFGPPWRCGQCDR